MMQKVFTDIFRRNEWQNAESVSGPGSTQERAAAFRDELIALLRELKAQTLLDAPCGDFNWMDDVARTVPSYIGVDVVEELIEQNRQKHGAADRQFICCDLANDPLPRADVILCRDCLVHFSFADISRALGNFKRSGSTFLLTTTFEDFRKNSDIETGGWRQLNFQRPPFNFPMPVAVIDEKCHHSGGVYADKRLALWRLADIAA